MTAAKNKLLISIAIKVITIVLLIIAASSKQEYSYYNLLRWCLSGTSIYFTYTSISKKEIGFTIYFLIIAILFNPFKKVWFQKDTWHFIDYSVALISALLILYELYQLQKIKNEKDLVS